VTALKRAAHVLVYFVLFPIAVVFAGSIVIAVGAVAFFVYVGGLLSVWLLFAYIFPLATGVMKPDEILAAIRSQRRDGSHFEGEPLPDDRALWMPWTGGESD
jgi:hypothetical protein